MADYKAMYAVLFRKITAVIEELQNVQLETEKMYISAETTNIKVIDIDKTEDEKPDIK